MDTGKKIKIRKLFGSYLKTRREDILGIKSLRQFSFSSNVDYSKLNKIEKGLVDIRFNTLIEVAITYRLSLTELLNFDIDFWNEEQD